MSFTLLCLAPRLVLGCLVSQVPGSAQATTSTVAWDEFLSARSIAWEASFPGPLRWEEDHSGPLRRTSWQGTLDHPRLNMRVQSSWGDQNDFAPGFEREPTMLAALLCNGESWLHVEKRLPSKRDDPWYGIESSTCPNKQWKETLAYSMFAPLFGKTLSQYIREHPMIGTQRVGQGVRVQFAATIPAYELFERGQFEHVVGFLGVEVEFQPSSDWRPIEMVEYYDASSVEGLPVEALHRSSFGDVDAFGLRTSTWSGWVDLSGVAIPTTYRRVSLAIPAPDGFTYRESVWRIEARPALLDGLPDSTSFGLVPPLDFGPYGRVTNEVSGEVLTYDARSSSSSRARRDEEIRASVSAAKTHSSAPSSREGRHTIRVILITLGSAILGFAIGTSKPCLALLRHLLESLQRRSPGRPL